MALPTITQLLLPEFSITTILGFLLIILGVFRNVVISATGTALSALTGGKIRVMTLRLTFIGAGIVMVWLPSILTDLFSSPEGIALFFLILLFITLILIIVFRFSGKKEKKEVFL